MTRGMSGDERRDGPDTRSTEELLREATDKYNSAARALQTEAGVRGEAFSYNTERKAFWGNKIAELTGRSRVR